MKQTEFTHDRYRSMIEAARAAGYRFATFDELAGLRASQERACLIRHDCDNDLRAALDLARIEAECGIRSTYFVMTRSVLYNIMAPPILVAVRGILGLGHRLGLHFDETPFAEQAPAAVAAQVDRERDWLAREFGQPIEIVSFHQPSPRVLANEIRLNCLNTYDKHDMAGVHYLSDSNMKFRGKTPFEQFESREHRLLQILLHPEWWTEEPSTLDDKWNRVLGNNIDTVQRELLKRELTYTVPRSVTVRLNRPATQE
jgi:hypothetical protein